MLVLVAVLGIVLPAQVGRPWMESILYIALWGWVPTFLVSTLIADSFAGERERHTLETLLASRLPDHAILFGKIAAAVAYGWGVSLMILVVGALAVNLAHWPGAIVAYSGPVALGAIGLSFFLSLTTASAGALTSLRASTVRQAQQILNLAITVVFVMPILSFQALPESTRAALLALLGSEDPTPLLAAALTLLALLNVALLSAAMARFQRAHLILD